MDIHIVRNNDQCDVSIVGQFTFADYKDFKTVLALSEDGTIKTILLDMTQVGFVDSAALGMMMILRSTSKDKQKIVLKVSDGQVKKVLKLSQFDTLFSMVDTA
jgi:anti-anti-sigma factor